MPRVFQCQLCLFCIFYDLLHKMCTDLVKYLIWKIHLVVSYYLKEIFIWYLLLMLMVLFFVPYIRFLLWVLEINQTVFWIKIFWNKIWRDILMVKRVEIFEHFSKKIYPAQNFSSSKSTSLIFLSCTKGVSFLEQNQLFQLLKMVEILH